MRAIRLLLAVLGTATAAYGAWLLYHWQHQAQLAQVARWAVAGLILHDGILAPLCLAIGWAGGKWLPRTLRTPAAIAFILAGTLCVSAFAVLGRSYGGGKNHSLLDRNYPVGLLLAVATIVAVVAVVSGTVQLTQATRRRSDGHGHGR